MIVDSKHIWQNNVVIVKISKDVQSVKNQLKQI